MAAVVFALAPAVYYVARTGGKAAPVALPERNIATSAAPDMIRLPAAQSHGEGWQFQSEQADFDANGAFALMDEASAGPHATVALVATDLQRVVARVTVGRVPFVALARTGHQLLISDQEASGAGYRLLVFNLDTGTLVREVGLSPYRLNKTAYGNAMTSSADGRFLYYTSVQLPSPLPSACTPDDRPARICDAFTLHVLDLSTYSEVSQIALPVNCGFTALLALPTGELSVRCPELGMLVAIRDNRQSSMLGEFRDVQADSANEPLAYWRDDTKTILLYADGTLLDASTDSVSHVKLPSGQRINAVAYTGELIVAAFGERKSSNINGYFTLDHRSRHTETYRPPSGAYAMVALRDGRLAFASHAGERERVTLVDAESGASADFTLAFDGQVTDIVS